MSTTPGARTDLTSSNDTTKLSALTKAGISRDQASQWERLAKIPAAEFEADLADPMWMPTTSGLLQRQEARERGPLEVVQGDEDALWLWGRLIDFNERGLLARDPGEVMAAHSRVSGRFAPRWGKTPTRSAAKTTCLASVSSAPRWGAISMRWGASAPAPNTG
jgi:hypothetical protein